MHAPSGDALAFRYLATWLSLERTANTRRRGVTREIAKPHYRARGRPVVCGIRLAGTMEI